MRTTVEQIDRLARPMYGSGAYASATVWMDAEGTYATLLRAHRSVCVWVGLVCESIYSVVPNKLLLLYQIPINSFWWFFFGFSLLLFLLYY